LFVMRFVGCVWFSVRGDPLRSSGTRPHPAALRQNPHLGRVSVTHNDQYRQYRFDCGEEIAARVYLAEPK
jgi:hypothetical protein